MEGAPETGLRATRGGERGEGHRGGSPELLRSPRLLALRLAGLQNTGGGREAREKCLCGWWARRGPCGSLCGRRRGMFLVLFVCGVFFVCLFCFFCFVAYIFFSTFFTE